MNILALFLGLICFVLIVHAAIESIKCKDYSMLIIMIIAFFIVSYADIRLIAELVSK